MTSAATPLRPSTAASAAMAETIKLRSSDGDVFTVSQDVALCVPRGAFRHRRCRLCLAANACATCAPAA